jgi:hypothetical protein
MEPTFYLGAKIKKTVIPNGVVAWGMSSSKYVQAAVQNVQEYLKKNGDRKLKKKASAPFEATYRVEIDKRPVLGPEMANYVQSQIGILRWCVELGRIDIITEVSMISTFLYMPREGHLGAVYHLFANLSLHHNATILTLICVLSSTPIGRPCMGTSKRQFLQTLLSQEEKQSTSVSLWIPTVQESTSRAARG